MSSSTAVHSETRQTLLAHIRIRIDGRLLLSAFALFVLFAALFAVVQYGTPALAGTDGYYHIKMGWLIRQQGLKLEFPWLPFTILNADAFYDHHLLYHVYLALFATVDPAVDGGVALTQAAKIASIIMPSLAFLAIWWLMRGLGVRWAAVWSLGLFAVSEAFLYRMSMPRAQSASLLVLVLALYWLLQGKHWRLLPLGFAYVWLYGAFPLLIVLSGIYVAATLIMERRLDWQALAYPMLGIGLGLLINPYFPEDINFTITHLLPKIGDSTTKVGNEWYPYETWTLVENSGFALAAFISGTVALGWREKRIDRPTLISLALAVLFGYMLFRSRRFVEYFPPFALVFATLAIAPLLQSWRPKRAIWHRLLPIGLLALLIYPLGMTLSDAREKLANAKPADRYAEASLWLRDHTGPEEMIFQTDWDDFTRLFFYNSDARYTAGLDPTLMELFDQALYDEWVSITRGKVENPSTVIQQRFSASYVFSDLKHGNFIDRAEADPHMEEVYRDDYAIIFAIDRN
jgi:hypothetical protein